MRSLRGWVLALVLALLIAAVAYLGQPKQDSPEHSSNSDAANGASAARLFAEAMGHPTSQIEGTFALPSSQGLIFVFTPTSAYSADDANQAASWVRVVKPSLARMRSTWPSAVRWAITSRAAMSLLDSPCVTSSATCRSRRVNDEPVVSVVRSDHGFVFGCRAGKLFVKQLSVRGNPPPSGSALAAITRCANPATGSPRGSAGP